MKKDNGYSWIVLFCSVFLTGLQSSIYNSYGIFFLEYVDYFHSSKTQAAVVASLYVTAVGLSALLAGPIVGTLGYRSMAMFAGLLSGIGLATASTSPNIYVVFVTHGILPGLYKKPPDSPSPSLSGIGEACSVISIWMALNSYFDKRHGLAMGLKAFGSSIGMFAGPPFARFLIDKYAWRGALILLAGCQIQGMVLSACLRPFHNKKTSVEFEKDTDIMDQTRDEKLNMVDNKNESNTECVNEQHVDRKKPPNLKFNRCKHGRKFMFSVSVFRDIRVILYYTGYFFIMAGHLAILVFSPPRGEFIGMSPTGAAFLMFITGICSAAVRPLFGWLGDRRRKHLIIIYSSPAILAGVLSIVSSYLEVVILIQIYAGLIGMCMAGYVVLHATVLGSLLPASKMPVGSGYHLLVHGASGLAANIAAGALVDLTGSFSPVFLFFGVTQIIGGSISLLIHVVNIRKRSTLYSEKN